MNKNKSDKWKIGKTFEKNEKVHALLFSFVCICITSFRIVNECKAGYQVQRFNSVLQANLRGG